MSSDDDCVREVVEELWPHHVAAVAETDFRRILSGERVEAKASTDISGGSPLDLAESLKILYYAVKLVVLARQMWRDHRDQKVTVKQLEEASSEQGLLSAPTPVMRKIAQVAESVSAKLK